jgi:hypothetical protein
MVEFPEIISGGNLTKIFGKNFSKADSVVDHGNFIIVKKHGRVYYSQSGKVFYDITNIYDEFEGSRSLSDVILKAFSFLGQIYSKKTRKETIELFCEHISDIKSCTAVVVSDLTGEYYRGRENVFHCKYLNYTPKVMSIVSSEFCECEKKVEHSYLFSMPYAEKSVVYIFLKEMTEEEAQIIKETVDVLAHTIQLMEVQEDKERALIQLSENLKYFELLADRLRNPLAIIKGFIEIKDEVGHEIVFRKIEDSANRIWEILNELSQEEIKTIDIVKRL